MPIASLPHAVRCRCADVERAFAKWQANRQAIVGFFPRLTSPGPPPQVCLERRRSAHLPLNCWRLPCCFLVHCTGACCTTAFPLTRLLPNAPTQYLGERHVFREMRYNTALTGFAFVSRQLLDLYWSDRYEQGRLWGAVGSKGVSQCACSNRVQSRLAALCGPTAPCLFCRPGTRVQGKELRGHPVQLCGSSSHPGLGTAGTAAAAAAAAAAVWSCRGAAAACAVVAAVPAAGHQLPERSGHLQERARARRCESEGAHLPAIVLG